MTIMWWLSQIVGFVGFAFLLWALQIKNKTLMLFLQGLGNTLLAVSCALLLNWTVAALIAVAAVRNFVFAVFEHKRAGGRAVSSWIPFACILLFMAGQCVSTAFLWEWWLDWVLLAALLIIAYGNWAKGPHIIRLGCVSYDSLVIINHIVFFNIIGIVQSVLLIGSTIVFYVRFFAKQKRETSFTSTP